MSYLNFNCKINIKDNPLNLDINDYLSVALRNNKKRKFLFVSKTLGKHLPINPNKVDKLGLLLAKSYKMKHENCKNERQLVIGFAETATCLSHSFFNYLESAEYFIHTTREEVKALKKLEFLEEHSHAMEQNLYIDNLNNINDVSEVILVDDEITTAKTCLNMISKIQETFKVKKFVIASVLNWIDEERNKEIQKVASSLGCSIEFVYLFNGNFEFSMENELEDSIVKVEESTNFNAVINDIYLDFEECFGERKYSLYTGRFGISRKMQEKLLHIIDRESKKLIPNDENSNILCLGIEEFMYIPMMLSKKIKGNVYYHSTTRSPIIPINDSEYPIKEKYTFESFYNKNINYIYNLRVNKYDECFLFMEVFKEPSKVNDFIKILEFAGIKKINIVRFFKE